MFWPSQMDNFAAINECPNTYPPHDQVSFLADENGQGCFELPKERLVLMCIAAKDAQCWCLLFH